MTLTLIDCIEQLTPAELSDPRNMVRLYANFILSEIVRHHTLIEKLSDRQLRDLKEILEELEDPKPSVRKCSVLTFRLVDAIESDNASDPDGSAIQRLRQLEAAIEVRQNSTGGVNEQ